MVLIETYNDFLQLFFGWEAVGVVSYLLIGFWFKKNSAIHANLKAFLVNRVGDFGFLLGIGLVVKLRGFIRIVNLKLIGMVLIRIMVLLKKIQS